jgi:hypothetical protein
LTSIVDLTALPATAAPDLLTRVGLPAGWRVGRYIGDDPTEPWRVAVRGGRPDGGWDACETITVFGFTGYAASQDVWRMCEDSLRALNAENVVIVEIDAPLAPGVSVVSGSGQFQVEDRAIRGQFNYYAAGSPRPGQGRVIQQCLYVDASRRAEFEVALAQLGDGLYIEFINGIGAAGTSPVLTPDGGTIPTAAEGPRPPSPSAL